MGFRQRAVYDGVRDPRNRVGFCEQIVRLLKFQVRTRFVPRAYASHALTVDTLAAQAAVEDERWGECEPEIRSQTRAAIGAAKAEMERERDALVREHVSCRCSSCAEATAYFRRCIWKRTPSRSSARRLKMLC